MPLTAATMTLDSVPEGSRPEEFLTDAGLAALYERELAALPEGDDRRPEMARRLSAARKAAFDGAESVDLYTLESEAELAKAKKKAK